MTTETPSFSACLRSFRERHSLTQAEAAKALFVSTRTWQAWEQEATTPRPTMRAAILTVIRVYDQAHPVAETTNQTTT